MAKAILDMKENVVVVPVLALEGKMVMALEGGVIMVLIMALEGKMVLALEGGVVHTRDYTARGRVHSLWTRQ